MADLELRIATPDKGEIKTLASSVSLPTVSGQITVLPGHVQLTTVLSPGEVVVRTGGKVSEYVVAGGFAKISQNLILVLADSAVNSSELAHAESEAMRKAAEAKLAEKEVSLKDFARAEADLARSLAEIAHYKKRKG